MITTGVIKQINVTSELNVDNNLKNVGNAYIYLIEIPIFHTPGVVDINTYTFNCTASVTGGVTNCYDVGDKVYVGFVNNSLDSPVILGKILKIDDNGVRGFYNVDTLNVSSNVTLPYNTKIGDLTYDDLFAMYQNSKIILASGKGDKGDKGDSGSSVLTGNYSPVSSIGNNGDSYIDTLTWNMYSKTSGVWSIVGNIKGEKGLDGSNGSNGSNGVDGIRGTIQWISKVEPSNNTLNFNSDNINLIDGYSYPIIGDTILTPKGDLYSVNSYNNSTKKISLTRRFNIKGPNGTSLTSLVFSEDGTITPYIDGVAQSSFIGVKSAITNANIAINNANTATNNVESVITNANTAILNANGAAYSATTATSSVNDALSKVNTATNKANNVSKLSVSLNDEGTLTLVTYNANTGEATTTSKNVKGIKGDKGRGVTSAIINSNNQLEITYDDETPVYVSDSLKGSKGDKGDTGAKGDQGPKGDTGAAGANGLTPFIGENGNWWIGETDIGIRAEGRDGSDGAPGKDGEKGEKGEQGIQGIQGLQGEKGDTGAKGATGTATMYEIALYFDKATAYITGGNVHYKDLYSNPNNLNAVVVFFNELGFTSTNIFLPIGGSSNVETIIGIFYAKGKFYGITASSSNPIELNGRAPYSAAIATFTLQ